jgi:hypothetical protein
LKRSQAERRPNTDRASGSPAIQLGLDATLHFIAAENCQQQ